MKKINKKRQKLLLSTTLKQLPNLVQLMNVMPLHIAILNASSVILAVNQAWRDFALANASNIDGLCEGANYLAVCTNAKDVNAEGADHFVSGMKQVLNGQLQEFSIEYPCHSPSEKRWFIGKITRFFANGAFRIIVTHENITQRKQMEENLKKSNAELQTLITIHKKAEEKFRLLLECAPDAMVIANNEGQISLINSQTEKMFGYKRDELCGQKIEILIPEQFRSKHPQHRLGYDSNPRIRPMGANIELSALHKNGKEFPVEISLSPLRTENEKFTIAAIRDITEKKKINNQLLRVQRMDSIGTLAGGIAHDLNNILAPILMGLELLRKRTDSEKNKKLFIILEEAAERGANMVRQILSFVRGVEGKYIETNISTIIIDVEKMVSETFPKSISIETFIADDLWTFIGDATQLYQVLMNLCLNARDAIIPNEGKIRIEASNISIDHYYSRMHFDVAPGQYVCVNVVDSGRGISSEYIDKIFEPFFTTKDIGKGTGLGLSTAFGIVKSHQGFMNVYSEIGKGTTFKIYLPISSNLQNQQNFTENEQTHELLMGNGELILVVEDELSIREITKATLEAYNYKVIVANDGTEALAEYVINKEHIKVVLMDMVMPHLDGQKTAEIMQKINPQVEIIMTSGFSINKTANVIGIKACLLKPYTAEKLLSAIKALLRAI